MTRLRSLYTGLLVALLVLTSQQMAAARGQSHAVSGEFILCQGGVAVTVSFDENGDPVGPVHYCPDCAIGLFSGLLAVEVALADPRGAKRTSRGNRSKTIATGLVQGSYARGPPSFV